MVLYLGGQGGESAWEDAEQILTVANPIISHDQFRYGVVGANDWCGAFQKTIAAKVKETTGKPYPFIGSADRVVIDTKSSIGSMVA